MWDGSCARLLCDGCPKMAAALAIIMVEEWLLRLDTGGCCGGWSRRMETAVVGWRRPTLVGWRLHWADGGCCAWMVVAAVAWMLVVEVVGWKLLWLDGGDLGGMKAALSWWCLQCNVIKGKLVWDESFAGLVVAEVVADVIEWKLMWWDEADGGWLWRWLHWGGCQRVELLCLKGGGRGATGAGLVMAAVLGFLAGGGWSGSCCGEMEASIVRWKLH